MSKEHLSTYLNDHLAGADFALEILDNLGKEASDLSPYLMSLKRAIEEDREQLILLMGRLHIAQSRVRQAGSWIAESLAEIKLGVDDDEKGPLRRLERLEALAIGIDGKLAMWQALSKAAAGNEELHAVDYDGLIERAVDQRSQVEILRLQAAQSALAA